jgi:heat shock protein HslJ
MVRLNTLRTWTLLTLGLLVTLTSACAPAQALSIAAPTPTPVPPTTTPEPPTATPVPPTATPAPELPSVPGPIAGIEWQWERFLSGDGSTIEVDDPSRYTLTLNADGTYQIRVDCNRGSGKYTLDGSSLLLEHGALTRAMCPPDSLHDTYLDQLSHVRTWVLDGDKLVLNLEADAGNMVFGQASAKAEHELTGIEWQWERFLSGDGSTIKVDDPSRYTLTLNADGTYAVRADCNRSAGGYTLDEAHLTLQPGPTTLAECGPESLYDAFLQQLGDVRTWTVTDDGKLVLDLWADAGQMVLRQG